MDSPSQPGSTPEHPRKVDASESRAVDELVAHGQTIANGVRLHYVEAGPEDGPPVLVLHGFPDFWYSWREQIPTLVDAGYRVLAPDLRGYNRSEKPHGVGAYRLETLTADVVAFLEGLEATPAHVVGHDWGGVLAWNVAMTHPAVLARLAVLNAPHPRKYVRELSGEQALRSWYALSFQLPWLPERLLTARGLAALEGVYREGTVRPEAFSDEELTRYRAAFRRPGALESALNYYRAFFRETVPANLPGAIPVVGDRLVEPVPTVDAPTLVVWGERDTALSLEQTMGLERYAETVRVERVPEAGHWVHLDAPGRVNEVLLTHLTG